MQLVIYVLCYDMKESRQGQINQIGYWLDYLNSTLPLAAPSTHNSESKWCIMIVGLRSDLQTDLSNLIQLKNLNAWQRNYTNLAIMNKLFTVSSFKSSESVEQLRDALEEECGRIFARHCVRIPRSYRSVLHNLEARPTTQLLVPANTLLNELQSLMKIDPPTFHAAIEYLHAIGRIVLLKNRMVCTTPNLIPQIAAKFISPEDVQLDLLKRETEEVQILSKEEVGCILQIDFNNNTR